MNTSLLSLLVERTGQHLARSRWIALNALLVLMIGWSPILEPTPSAAAAERSDTAPAIAATRPISGSTFLAQRGDAAVLVPLTPCRLADTRSADNAGSRIARWTHLVKATGRCGVPNGAVAISVSLTASDTVGAGYLTAYPARTKRPTASNLNWTTNQTRANGAIVRLDRGEIELFTSTPASVVVDVTAAFVPAKTASAGRLVAMNPTRVVDTRHTGPLDARSTIEVTLPSRVPSDAIAVATTITTTESRSAGYLAAFPTGTRRPLSSVLNTDGAGQTRATGGVVAVNRGGFDIYSSHGGHVVVDITGYFTGPSAPEKRTGRFVATAPRRLRDTRVQPPQAWPRGTIEVATPPGAALAANVTIASADAPGYVTAHAARRTRPASSTVNATVTGDVVAAFAVVPTSTRGVALYSQSGSELVVDQTGWFTGTPLATTTGRAPNRRAGTAARSNKSSHGPLGCVAGGSREAGGMIRSHPTALVWISHYRRSGPKGPIAVIGDSLTEGIYADLAAALHKEGWGPICVNAGRSRFVARPAGLASGQTTVASLRRSHPVWRSGNVTWVIALGTNDAGLSSVQADFDHMVDLVGKARSVHWVDVRTHRGGHHSADEKEFNALIIGDASVQRIRWARLVDAHPQYLGGDGIHLSSSGERPGISLIVDSVGWRGSALEIS